MKSAIAQLQEITLAVDYTIQLLKMDYSTRTTLEKQVLENLERIREGLDGN